VNLQFASLLTLLLAFLDGTKAAEPRPGPVPEELRKNLKLDPFYQKHLDADGLSILGSAKVSDDALAEAAWIVRHMLAGREDIRKAMIGQKVRAVIMAKDEYTTDVPEHRNLKPKQYWDRRARGLGATPHVPVVSGAEENLLNFRNDPYPNENIFLHEFSHAIHGTGLNKVDPSFDQRLRMAYEAAKERGLWKNTYAITNRSEYWAEGVQSWFDDNAPPDELHNDIRTREKLKAYDPELAKLCKEVFGDGEWRYVKPSQRNAKDRAHLTNYDPKNAPRFRWRDIPPSDRPQVTIQTALGDFDVELDSKSAPKAVANFLKVALNGGYHSGTFERIAGGGAWATVAPQWKEKWATDTSLEKVEAVKELPKIGTIALVKEEGEWIGFAVFLGEKLDVGSAEIVPIGQITKGKETVLKILETSSTGKPVGIRRVIRNE
jgi:cyclophilin family peptidyl-prolyl cis-trans isomerase